MLDDVLNKDTSGHDRSALVCVYCFNIKRIPNFRAITNEYMDCFSESLVISRTFAIDHGGSMSITMEIGIATAVILCICRVQIGWCSNDAVYGLFYPVHLHVSHKGQTSYSAEDPTFGASSSFTCDLSPLWGGWTHTTTLSHNPRTSRTEQLPPLIRLDFVWRTVRFLNIQFREPSMVHGLLEPGTSSPKDFAPSGVPQTHHQDPRDQQRLRIIGKTGS
ncbi:hypothetical protein GWK47_020153 [Chionoecetes opilio]|uniref:Uncharacterized protein n=1 Tax=Chionoecetes opilio TaxID=41210 RepID=A0A8J4XTY5_CHIOP|nr:hypothetical protein GWK47_020153 [Chionoecetes opilio]